MKALKKFLKAIGIIIGIVVLLFALVLAIFSLIEYKPGVMEAQEVKSFSDEGVKTDFSQEPLTIVTFNIGYGGLGKDSQFVMDGGTGNGTPESQEIGEAYFAGIQQLLMEQDADVYMLQEVDEKSTRSYKVNQVDALAASLQARGYANALNYKCLFVPYPLPPIGSVKSGVETIAVNGEMTDSMRYSLPCPFGWPLRLFNLKRCMLVSHVQLEGLDKPLSIINFHLEAYSDDAGRLAQTAQVMNFIKEEYEAGYYVIAGGDWNQTFPGSLDTYPIKPTSNWTPNVMETESVPNGFTLVYDDSTPTCRLLNQPYDPDSELTQFYVIDGFVVSPGVNVQSVETIDAQFANSDHNPVKMVVSFG